MSLVERLQSAVADLGPVARVDEPLGPMTTYRVGGAAAIFVSPVSVADLEEGPFADELHADEGRYARYKQSKLSLTALGQAVLAGTEDFSRHNPIHRWWGGTELSNDNHWRWDPVNHALIAP